MCQKGGKQQPLKLISNEEHFFQSKNVMSKNIGPYYRIYSRISREILDKNTSQFNQFDLYAGQDLTSWNFIQIPYFCALRSHKVPYNFLKFLILVKFSDIFFRFDLYAGRLIREYIWYFIIRFQTKRVGLKKLEKI